MACGCRKGFSGPRSVRGSDPCKLNDRERSLWVQNDEGLYSWWRRSRRGLRAFIRENRTALDAVLKHRLGCGEEWSRSRPR